VSFLPCVFAMSPSARSADLSDAWTQVSGCVPRFVEVFIFIVAISQVHTQRHELAQRARLLRGVRDGHDRRVTIEERIALALLARVASLATTRDWKLPERLRESDFGARSRTARGATGRSAIVETAVHRRDVPRVQGGRESG